MSVPIYAPIPTRSFHVRLTADLPNGGEALKSPEITEEVEKILNLQAVVEPTDYPDRRAWNPMFKKRSTA